MESIKQNKGPEKSRASAASLFAYRQLKQQLHLSNEYDFRVIIADQHIRTVVVDWNASWEICHLSGELQVVSKEVVIQAD